MVRITAALFAVLASCLPAVAQVQRTHWGVSAGVTPQWEVPNTFKQLFDADSVTFEGRDLRIGIVRGATFGGDWGISFIRKDVSDRSNVSRPSGQCLGCGQFLTSPDVRMTGIEFHRFMPFGTLKDRVQIGMTFAGGVAELKGSVRVDAVTPAGTDTQSVEAKNVFAPWMHNLRVVPLGRIELTGAAILGPGLKLRAGGGLDFPGYNRFNVALVYLFGAR